MTLTGVAREPAVPHADRLPDGRSGASDGGFANSDNPSPAPAAAAGHLDPARSEAERSFVVCALGQKLES